jgi:phosphoserine aminotransferase
MTAAAGRIHNFNAGPAALPLEVLGEIQESFLNFAGSGMSITEISHRSKWFETVINDAVARVKRLLGLDARYKVLFLQGGASLQFAMLPMNFLPAGRSADYVNTGTWSTKAIQECAILGRNARVAASSEDREFRYIPRDIRFDGEAVYAHITSNNTIRGTQFAAFPDADGVPLVADMSSDIMSRPFDPAPFGLFYAGAQKNIGPAGVTLVVVREDFLAGAEKNLPTMLRYGTFADKNSLYNTPPCFAIYAVQLVLKWIEETVGGLERMAARNREKARCLYALLDAGGFYRGTADPDSRSTMNVTFRLPSEALEGRFIQEAQEAGFGGLKGHRSVGGCRASLYNATSLQSVQALCAFMTEFARRNG